MNCFKVIISGGGTGGHIYPAIAIVKEILIEQQMPKFYLLEHMEEWKWRKSLKTDLTLLVLI